jgi:transposase-like protein
MDASRDGGLGAKLVGVSGRHDREFWKRACMEVRRGGKICDVARRLGVKPRTLQWWSWKLGEVVRVEQAEFLPVVVAGHPATAVTAAIELEANGVRIRVETGVDVRYVAELVAAIRGAC